MSYIGCWSGHEQREDPERAFKNINENQTILPNNHDSGRNETEDAEQDCEEYDSRDEDSYGFSLDDLESDDYDDCDDAGLG